MQSKLVTPQVWSDDWSTPKPLLQDATCDVCVVGLGASGLTAIIELASADYQVIGIDAADVGAGAAGRNGGFLLAGDSDFYHEAVKKYGRAEAKALYEATIKELELLFRLYPGCSRNVGSLRIAFDDDEYQSCKEQYAAMKADGLPVEWYNGPEGRGLLFPTDGCFNPLARARLMAHTALRFGAQLHGSTTAVDIKGTYEQCGTGVTVKCGTGATIKCRKAIVAVDGRLEVVLPELGSRIRTTRLQMIATAPAHDVTFTRPVYRRGGYDYW